MFVARMASGSPLDEVARAEIEADARQRLSQQLDDDWKAARSDYVLTNDGAGNLTWAAGGGASCQQTL